MAEDAAEESGESNCVPICAMQNAR